MCSKGNAELSSVTLWYSKAAFSGGIVQSSLVLWSRGKVQSSSVKWRHCQVQWRYGTVKSGGGIV